MKVRFLLAPTLALAGSAYWLHQQNTTIKELTQNKQIITERLALAQRGTVADPADSAKAEPSAHPASGAFTLPDGSLDWQKIADVLGDLSGKHRTIQEAVRLKKFLLDVSEEELTDGLAQINAMTLSSEAHDQIKRVILTQLSSLNPLAALQALGDPVTSNPNPLFSAQEGIFAKAVKEDPAFAMAWLDQKIADGKLQSSSFLRHNNLLIQLEGCLVNHLLSSDLAAAKKRLTSLSEENVIDILNSTRPSEAKDIAQNLIQLARESLPPELASETITRAWQNSNFNDLTKISDSIRDVPFTESERDQVVSTLIDDYARKHNQESHLTEIYRWSKQEAPGQESKLVSRVLANQALASPQEAFEKALSLAESLGEPTIATGFVERVHAGRELDPIVENFKSPELAAKYRAMVSAYSQEPAATE